MRLRLDEKPIEQQIDESSHTKVDEEIDYSPNKGNFALTVSTGSTLLDLDISGLRTSEGGVPAGILLEIFGPNSVGKTAILSEIGGSTEHRGGEVDFLDPEHRLDHQYAQIYGVHLGGKNYKTPDTVSETFALIKGYKPKNKNVINTICADSLAALTTELELEKGDKMGMKRGKDFSAGLRQVCRKIAQDNLVIACSNQIRTGDRGEFTPGGMGIPFYASLRIKLWMFMKDQMTHKVDLTNVEATELSGEFNKVTGSKVHYQIVKSSLDEPYRTGFFYLVYRYGIDDIRGCLQYNKEVTADTTYDCCGNNKRYQSLDRAVTYVEQHQLQDPLRQKTIRLWNELQEALTVKRPPKVRR